MTRGIICKVCRNKKFDKTEQEYGYRPTYLWNEPYTQTAYIKKNFKQNNNTYKTKWIKIGHYCVKCNTFYRYFKFPYLFIKKWKYKL